MTEGQWAHECVTKEYDPIDPETMADDPAEYAVEQGLVDVHDDPKVRDIVGAWRWSALSLHRHRLVPLIRDNDTIDFGGAAGPCGYGATVVDCCAELFKAVYDVPGPCSCIFTSHVLEHIPCLTSVVASFYHRLTTPGYLIVYVPSYRSENLRAENFPHHCQTFCLSTDENTQPQWVPLDLLLSPAFNLELCCHISGGILAIGKKV